ncbi:flippase [Telmatospirillum sp.]|uniref:flippase n=1 Tax=Telmatospirillum sp. TaxID=2079197 RepID=UPI0028424E04|nr:flippase [Telmatospirillum sp.]MDR3441051.1 flippase [Telmatospirillum sp.]
MADGKITRLAGIAANVSWTSFEQILRVGLSFLVTVQVINYLGPERFGLYSYVISVVGILAPLTAFGLEQVVIRRLVEYPADRDRLLGTTFAIRLVCGVVGFAVALAIVLILDHGSGLRLRLTAVAGVMLLLQATDTVAFFFKAIMGAKHIALARLVGLLTASATTIVLLLVGSGVAAFLWMRGLEAGVTGVALLLAYRQWGGRWTSWRFDASECRSLLKAGFPLFIASFAVMVYMRVDQLMLGQLSSEEELGYYGVAVRLAEVLNFVPVAIVTAFYPTLVECHQQGAEAFRRRIQGLYNLMALIGYATAVTATLAAPLGFRILFGHRYDAALPMFNLLVWGMLFVCLGVAMNAMLTVIGRNWISAVATLVGMVVNVLLNFWLIPKLGAVGSAWATLVSYWVAAHGVFLFLPEFYPTFRMIGRAMLWPDIRLLRPGRPDKAH